MSGRPADGAWIERFCPYCTGPLVVGRAVVGSGLNCPRCGGAIRVEIVVLPVDGEYRTRRGWPAYRVGERELVGRWEEMLRSPVLQLRTARGDQLFEVSEVFTFEEDAAKDDVLPLVLRSLALKTAAELYEKFEAAAFGEAAKRWIADLRARFQR